MTDNTVWVVFRDIAYEGSDVVAICRTEAEADAICDECLAADITHDGVRVEPYELGKSALIYRYSLPDHEAIALWSWYLTNDASMQRVEGVGVNKGTTFYLGYGRTPAEAKANAEACQASFASPAP